MARLGEADGILKRAKRPHHPHTTGALNDLRLPAPLVVQEYAEMLAKGKLMAMMQETQKRKVPCCRSRAAARAVEINE